jgi:hypothetical protein
MCDLSGFLLKLKIVEEVEGVEEVEEFKVFSLRLGSHQYSIAWGLNPRLLNNTPNYLNPFNLFNPFNCLCPFN